MWATASNSLALAMLRLAATYIQSYDHEQALIGTTSLRTWLADHPHEALASAMWQYLGDTYFFPLADYPQSLHAYEQADRLGWIDQPNLGRVYWRIAVLAERELRNRDLAVKYYTKIIREAPTSGDPPGANGRKLDHIPVTDACSSAGAIAVAAFSRSRTPFAVTSR